MKILILAVFMISFSLVGISSAQIKNNKQSALDKAEKLYDEEKYDECLKLINLRIADRPEEKKEFSDLRFNVLTKLGLNRDALNVLLENTKEEKVKSVSTALKIGDMYRDINNYDSSFVWYNIAIDNGFIFFPPFEEFDVFKEIRKDVRFEKLIKRMKNKIGLGKAIINFEAKDITGKMISPGLFINKVVLIDFWATWCLPCMKEMPNLKEIYNDFNNKGFELISISLDTEKNKLTKFIKEFNPPWPIVYNGKGFDDEIAMLYKVKDLPSVWLVDKKGILRHVFLTGEKLRDAVKNLIDE